MKGLVLDAKWEPRPDYKLSEWEKETGKAITGSSIWRHPTLKVRDWPDPEPGPTQVLLEVQACGICGSDIHFYETDNEGYIFYPGLTKFPTITGHEFSGKVIELGKEVTQLKVGDMVTVEEMVWCGRCIPCRNGYPNHCANLEEIGFTIPGAFANYIAVDEKLCWKIDAIAERFGSEEMAYEVGALSEPTSVSYNALFERGGGFRPGHYFSVFGAGPIGLAAIGLAKAAGAGMIVAFEISPQRRELAKLVGADYVYDPKEVTPHTVLMELSKGEGFNFLYEASGVPELVIPEMEKSLAINGKIVQTGRAAKRVPIYLETLQVRRSQLFGSQGHSGHENFPNVIRLVASGRLDLSPIITARYKLNEVVEAIARSGARTDGKIMVKPN
jgi:threonine dehydrogenase-like Zn-dependent dehydrogenase